MTLTTNGRNYIGKYFGDASRCFTSSGLNWTYLGTDSVVYTETNGGTAMIVSNLVMTSLVQSVTINGVTFTYNQLKAANDNINVTLDDAKLIQTEDTNIGGEIQFCAPITGGASFTSTPSGARVWIDGTDSGSNTPITITGLSDISHAYRLVLAGYADSTGNFTVIAGQTTTVPLVTFAPSASTTSTPSGARIWIDGVDKGVNTPSTITGLAAGSRAYSLVLAGYSNATGNFTATAGQTVSVPVTFAPSATITSTPSGARIWIDAVDKLVNTPSTITGLAAGVRAYNLVLSGYSDSAGNFTATAGQTVSVPVTFAPSASFTSVPTGARIWIDGVDQGVGKDTPFTITGLSAGIHSYKLTKVGYADYSGSFTATSGQTTVVPLVTFTASASITSTPSGARIWIDGSDSGVNTPSTITGLTAGSRAYSLVLAGYSNATGNFTATAGQTVSVPVTFAPSASFTSNPTGARIWIDSVDQGVGKDTPFTITGLTAGTHSYALTYLGYVDATGNFIATAGQTTTVPLATLNVTICSWITGIGGIAGINSTRINTLADANLGIGSIGFTPTIPQVFGAIYYYIGFTSSGNTNTGCSF